MHAWWSVMDKWTVDNKQNTNGEQPVAAATMVVATMAAKRKQEPVGPG